MSTFRLEVRIHSRGSDRGSMVAAAAYRSAGRLAEDVIAGAAYRSGEALESGGEVHDFTRKRGVVASEIHAPQDTPERLLDRGTLWREVERSERRRDARLAREFIVSIPRGLSTEQGVDLVRGWVNEQLVERGMIADVAWHRVKARDGGENFHAHVLCTTREVGLDGFGRKVRDWDKRELVVQEWRPAWAEHCNFQLEQAGLAERVNHRSLAAQRDDALARGDLATLARVDREPVPKLGRAAAQMEREGHASRRGEMLRQVEARNRARRSFYDRMELLGEQARARFMQARDSLGDLLDKLNEWRAKEPFFALQVPQDVGRDAGPERAHTGRSAEPSGPEYGHNGEREHARHHGLEEERSLELGLRYPSASVVRRGREIDYGLGD